MEQSAKKYGSFEDLDVYKAAREFRKSMYQIARSLPDSEKFVLNPQIRKAALSVTNNIAEGHGRYHYLDNIHFMLIARGSVEELMDDLNTCEDEAYLLPGEITRFKAEAVGLMRQINGYIRYLRESKAGANLGLHEDPSPYQAEEDDFAWLNVVAPPSPITSHHDRRQG